MPCTICARGMAIFMGVAGMLFAMPVAPRAQEDHSGLTRAAYRALSRPMPDVSQPRRARGRLTGDIGRAASRTGAEAGDRDAGRQLLAALHQLLARRAAGGTEVDPYFFSYFQLRPLPSPIQSTAWAMRLSRVASVFASLIHSQ